MGKLKYRGLDIRNYQENGFNIIKRWGFISRFILNVENLLKQSHTEQHKPDNFILCLFCLDFSGTQFVHFLSLEMIKDDFILR